MSINDDMFREVLDRNLRRLNTFGQRRRRSCQLESQRMLHGEFRSRHRTAYGMERDVPRVFELDDDPACLDLRHLDPMLIEQGLMEAILAGRMRLIQSILLVESEFIVVVDLSPSILGGCFSDRGGIVDRTTSVESSLGSLCCAVGAFIELAEASRFAIRVLYMHGDRIGEDRARNPQDFLQRVTATMRQSLLKTYGQCEERPDWQPQRPFLLQAALNCVLAVRSPSVLVVISDFLDPFDRYKRSLAEVMARHRVLLVDVCPGRILPEPTWAEYDVVSVRLREGPWHAEEGTQARFLTRQEVQNWNRERRNDEAGLRRLCRRFSARSERFAMLNYRDGYMQALQWLSSLR